MLHLFSRRSPTECGCVPEVVTHQFFFGSRPRCEAHSQTVAGNASNATRSNARNSANLSSPMWLPATCWTSGRCELRLRGGGESVVSKMPNMEPIKAPKFEFERRGGGQARARAEREYRAQRSWAGPEPRRNPNSGGILTCGNIVSFQRYVKPMMKRQCPSLVFFLLLCQM